MREERNSINHRHPLLAAAFEEEQRRRPRRRSPPKRAVARPVSFGDLTEVARREEVAKATARKPELPRAAGAASTRIVELD